MNLWMYQKLISVVNNKYKESNYVLWNKWQKF